MKENENGWGVISGSHCETSANYYEWETAAELMKKKKKERKNSHFFFFIRHPRIIKRTQAVWWGWRKPQDTRLTSCHWGGRGTLRGESGSRGRGHKEEFLVTVVRRGQVEPKRWARIENRQGVFLKRGNKILEYFKKMGTANIILKWTNIIKCYNSFFLFLYHYKWNTVEFKRVGWTKQAIWRLWRAFFRWRKWKSTSSITNIQ